MLRYKRVGVTVKSGLSYKHEAVLSIIGILEREGVDVLIDDMRLKEMKEASDHASFKPGEALDLLVVIGGDGTILRAIRELQHYDTPVFSINRGTLGFMAEAELDEADALLPKMLHGGGVIEERSIIHVSAYRGLTKLYDGYALNDAVIAQGTIARLVDLKTTVNGEDLTTYNADGLIIATPTGSTAYSLAAGGPIVHPTLDATILTPINPHSFSQKPVVIPSSHEISVEVIMKENKYSSSQVILTIDGQVSVALTSTDVVRCCGCNHNVKFLRREQDTFFGTLRTKLKWGESSDRNGH